MTTSSSTIGWRGHALDSAPRGVDLEALRPERHRLIEAHVAADDRRLADHDARSVVDEEAFADLRARMDVDAGRGMRDFRDDPREHRRAETIEHVRQTMAR